jgi:hypothetical protein
VQFLLSTGLKDISVVFTLRRESEPVAAWDNLIHVPIGNKTIYSVCSVIDLDTKHVNKLPHYAELDHAILHHFHHFIEPYLSSTRQCHDEHGKKESSGMRQNDQ